MSKRNKFEVFIISYLGIPGSDLYEYRLNVHNKQLDWILEKTDVPINILAMEYASSEHYRKEAQIRYFKYDTKMHQGSARNILIHDHFYDTDLDFAVFFDNDSILYDHFDGPDFFDLLERLDFTGVDLFVPGDPGRAPFNKKVADSKEVYDNYLVMEPKLIAKTSLFVMRNLKKYYDYSPSFTNLRMEDLYFSLDLNKNGHRVCQTLNFILKEFASQNERSLIAPNIEDRREWIAEAYNEFLQENDFIERYVPGDRKANTQVSRKIRSRYCIPTKNILISKQQNEEDSDLWVGLDW